MPHWLHVFATFAPGGPQVRTAQILERLGPSYRHTIVAMDGRFECADRLSERVRRRLEPPPPRRGFWSNGRALAARMRALDPDLVLTYNWGAVEALLGASLAGIRQVVHHEEGFREDELEGLKRRRNVARRLLLRRARRVVVPSLRLADVARRVWRQAEDRVAYLPNGVDLRRFAPRPRASRAGDRVVIGCVSAFRTVKNQPLLIRAFARMRHRKGARLVLLGGGEGLEGARALVRDLGLAADVEFRPPVADTSTVYGDFDVFALASLTEQMPLVVLEAMACGLPVVATDVGDVGVMLAEENRDLVVPGGDEVALAAALDEVVERADLRAALGAANRRRCEAEFELDRCLRRYEELYVSCARAPGAD